MDKEGIIGSIIFLSITVLSFVYGFYLVDKGVEIDTTPLYWPETFEPYPEPDWEDSDEWHEMWYNKLDTNSNGEVDKLEYHGKEGRSEYGEYKPNKCLEWNYE